MTFLYGIRVPKSVREAVAIDKENNNTLWQEAIELEMKNVKVAFELCETNPKDLVGYKHVGTHMIFDIKLGENFRRKARLVADGHRTSTPTSVTYSSVVGRDSVRICLLLAALNNLDIQCADIKNAYLTAPTKEKLYTWAGPEFGPDSGKPFLITRALYGLKSSGASFRAFLAEHLDRNLGFQSTIADPDVWRRPAVKHDGEKYYEYLLCYVDDVLCVSDNPSHTMQQIKEKFNFKGNTWHDLDIYLGAKITKKVHEGTTLWTMTSLEYLKAAIKEIEAGLKDRGLQLPKKAATAMHKSYKPELDSTPELPPEDFTFFQELIGILR